MCHAGVAEYVFPIRRQEKTVFAFLDWLRLKKAAELLRTTRLSVTDIAYCTGFSDSNYFTNAFRKREGCSPSVYRKSAAHRTELPQTWESCYVRRAPHF